MIGINFVGKGTTSGTVYSQPLAATESAGVSGFTQSNWNNAAGSNSTGQSLHDENGQGTGATLSWTYAGKSYTSISDTPGDRRMMRGYIYQFSSAPTVTVSGLGTAFTSPGYDVLVYFDGENTNNAVHQDWMTEYVLTVAGSPAESVFGKDAGWSNFDGTFVQATGATAAGATAGNYVRFHELTASSFTLVGTPVSGEGPINAIQIISAPEPGTLGLVVLGAAVMFRRRRAHPGR